MSTTNSDWTDIASRARAHWRVAGGSYDRLAELMWAHARFSVNAETLAQTMRGRKPREVERYVESLAKVFAVVLKSRCDPPASASALEGTFKSYLYGRSRSPIEKDTEPAISPPPASATSQFKLTPLGLWTPGQNREQLAASLIGVDPETAVKVADLSDDAIDAIAEADFKKQLRVANKVIEIGDAHPGLALRSEGLYLKGEALRLLADFTDDRVQAKELRESAISSYRTSDALMHDARSVRGLARTTEVLGDAETALADYRLASTLAETQVGDSTQASSLAYKHEQLRSLRHRMSCLASLHASSLAHTSAAHQREAELRRLLLESETRHREAMPLFSASRNWWRIEWFMSEVIHANVYLALRDFHNAAKHLQWALSQRLAMLPAVEALSEVELGNLQWWLRAAVRAKHVFSLEQEGLLDQFADIVTSAGALWAAKSLGERFLNAGEAPWITSRTSTA